jgi:hypothetical protein
MRYMKTLSRRFKNGFREGRSMLGLTIMNVVAAGASSAAPTLSMFVSFKGTAASFLMPSWPLVAASAWNSCEPDGIVSMSMCFHRRHRGQEAGCCHSIDEDLTAGSQESEQQ